MASTFSSTFFVGKLLLAIWCLNWWITFSCASSSKIKENLLENSEKDANRIFRVYRTVAKLSIGISVLIIAIIGYIFKQETDSSLSVIAYIFSGISLLISLISWKTISTKLKKKAFQNYNALLNQ